MIYQFFKFLAFVLTVLLAACGPQAEDAAEGGGHDHGAEAEGAHEDDDHDHHHDEKGEGGASFVEDKGIALIGKTKKALGLELMEAKERKMMPIVTLEAQVYRSASEPSRPDGEQTGSAYATALLAPQLAAVLKAGDSGTLRSSNAEYSASVWKVDPASKAAVNNEEIILQIPDPSHGLRVGEFVFGSITKSSIAEAVVSVPRSAVLETITGKFVFVVNDDYLLRTPVTTGTENAGFIEIINGLDAGAIVATQPVETLYLIELRATKGGGHSH